MQVYESVELQKKYNEVKRLAQELYTEFDGRRVVPMYPHVLVLVLPKEQQLASGIILPEGGRGTHDKPNYEGIVLETWEPRWTQFRETKAVEGGRTIRTTREVLLTSKFEPGDHVMFPHWAGHPAGFLDESAFRMVKEDDFAINQVRGEIFAKIDHDNHSELYQRLQEAVQRALAQYALQMPDVTARTVVAEIEKEAYLADRKQKPVSIRGGDRKEA